MVKVGLVGWVGYLALAPGQRARVHGIVGLILSRLGKNTPLFIHPLERTPVLRLRLKNMIMLSSHRAHASRKYDAGAPSEPRDATVKYCLSVEPTVG